MPSAPPQVPGKLYRYKVAHGGAVGTFRAPVEPGPERRGGFTFVVYGDMGDADHKAAKSPG